MYILKYIVNKGLYWKNYGLSYISQAIPYEILRIRNVIKKEYECGWKLNVIICK